MAATNDPHRDPDRRDPAATPHTRRNGWLPWVIGGILLLLLIFALRSCGDDDRVDTDLGTEEEAAMAPAGTAADGTLAAGEPVTWDRAAFTTYLGGTEPLGRVFALERVTFRSGSALLSDDARSQIGEVAEALKARPAARVSLRGYADPAGDAAANQALSEQRTQAVRNALIDAGAGEAQVAAASAMGETGTKPIESNRRVEITVTAR